jgi:hypothetical protein
MITFLVPVPVLGVGNKKGQIIFNGAGHSKFHIGAYKN